MIILSIINLPGPAAVWHIPSYPVSLNAQSSTTRYTVIVPERRP